MRHSFQASDVHILLAGLLIFVELMLVIAIALCFSTFSTPAISRFTFSLYVIGHFNSDIRQYGVTSDLFPLRSSRVFSTICFPTLQTSTSFQGQLTGSSCSGVYLFSLAYGLLFSIALVLVAMLVFQRRDFK